VSFEMTSSKPRWYGNGCWSALRSYWTGSSSDGIVRDRGITNGLVVRKYGGSSLATLHQVRQVAMAVADASRSARLVVVVSARGQATDDLLCLAAQVGGTPSSPRSSREVDQLLATGEGASSALLAIALRQLSVPAVSLSGAQAGIRAGGRHGSGVIKSIDTGPIRRLLAEGNVVVVAGFQGVNADGDVVTLGRGGSDTTAVALAAELSADRCEIFTDVDGVFTADPRVIPDAQVLADVDSGVMVEMAFAGAKVLHSRAVELAAMNGVDVHVGNTCGEALGTVVTEWPEHQMLENRGVLVAVTHDLDVARVLVHSAGPGTDLAAELLGVLARHSVAVDLVARSGPNEEVFRMGFTIRRSDVDQIRQPLQDAVGDAGGVRVDDNIGKLSLIGVGLLNRPEYTARLFAALSAADIPTSWVSTSQLRTSVTVPLDRVVAAVAALHREFRLCPDDLRRDDLRPDLTASA
jgi:aspartate kinase